MSLPTELLDSVKAHLVVFVVGVSNFQGGPQVLRIVKVLPESSGQGLERVNGASRRTANEGRRPWRAYRALQAAPRGFSGPWMNNHEG